MGSEVSPDPNCKLADLLAEFPEPLSSSLSPARKLGRRLRWQRPRILETRFLIGAGFLWESARNEGPLAIPVSKERPDQKGATSTLKGATKITTGLGWFNIGGEGPSILFAEQNFVCETRKIVHSNLFTSKQKCFESVRDMESFLISTVNQILLVRQFNLLRMESKTS